jgi:hypothetical protein
VDVKGVRDSILLMLPESPVIPLEVDLHRDVGAEFESLILCHYYLLEV